MAESGSGPSDKSVQVKLVLLGTCLILVKGYFYHISIPTSPFVNVILFPISPFNVLESWVRHAYGYSILTGEAAVGKSSVVLRFVSLAVLVALHSTFLISFSGFQ